jgi:hypothetical protein
MRMQVGCLKDGRIQPSSPAGLICGFSVLRKDRVISTLDLFIFYKFRRQNK